MATPDKTISILKMGFAEPELLEKYGDYVDMVRTRLPAEMRAGAKVVDAETGVFPEPASVDALVITGSSSMVTDPTPNDLRAFEWLQKVVKADVPVLGICYGHQMLGHVLGGKVGPLPDGPEIGLADVTFDDAAKSDPLFADDAGGTQRVAVIHWQTVLKLPPGATVLGRGERDAHHAVRFAPRVWGVQFHPEFAGEVMSDYVRMCAEYLPATVDATALAAETGAWADGTDVIRRFAELTARTTAVAT